MKMIAVLSAQLALLPLSLAQTRFLGENVFERKRPFSSDYQRTNSSEMEINGLIDSANSVERFQCRRFSNQSVTYASEKEKSLSVKTWIAQLQMIGIHSSLKGLAKYGMATQQIPEMIAESCSPNMTLYSREKLSEVFQDYENQFEAKRSTKWMAKSYANLLKVFCSWGQDPRRPRLLAQALRSPLVVALVKAHVENQALVPAEIPGVECNEFLCRPRTVSESKKAWPRPMGDVSFSQELQYLVCTEFTKFVIRDDALPMPIKSWSELHRPFRLEKLNLFFVSEIVAPGVMENLMAPETNGLEFLSKQLDEQMKNWAALELQKVIRRWNFESPVLIERMPIRLNRLSAKYESPWEIPFSVTWGQSDRVFRGTDKIQAHFDFTLRYSLASFFQRRMKRATQSGDDDLKESLQRQLRGHLKEQYQSQVYKLQSILPPETLLDLFAEAALDLMAQKRSSRKKTGPLTIRFQLYFGTFALKFFHQKWLAGQNGEKQAASIDEYQN